MSDVQPLETPFEEEVDEQQTESWNFEQGDEIVPGRHALTKLGGGTAYEAYLAWDETLMYLVVAKIVRPHLVKEEWAERSLAREAGAIGRLQHPMLVRGFGAVLAGERPHIVMEHLEGPHLARLIRRHGPLPLEQFIPLAINLCSVTHYLGTEKMVHLDIKPRNIVVGIPPKLIDLSVARSFSQATRITGHVGTDLYMAPEQCEPNKRHEIGPWSDVYGLGATLYEAVSGQPAFTRPDDYNKDDLYERFPQIIQEPYELDPKRVPSVIGEMLLQSMLHEPSERPTPLEMAERLEPLLAALPRKHRLGKLRPRLT
ncbi:MAG: eukaryotic-like serine/threonine-protein kinase [Actinomycetota bacterium]|jgi:serine/threonine protein kinase|nr:eukaryotic-like serine/threonine-protein kinase [Actinomycetota bacterium]